MADHKPFVSDIENIRKRARMHIERGAVTAGYIADRETVIRVLNEALATEIVCVLRYKYHYFMASGIHASSVAAEFLEHANEEQEHADRLPNASPSSAARPPFARGLLTRHHSDYAEGADLLDMIRRIWSPSAWPSTAIARSITYSATRIRLPGALMAEILAVEE